MKFDKFDEKLAKQFLGDISDSLSKEVDHCMSYDKYSMEAPNAALLLCFAHIDYMGAFLTGDYDSRKEAENSRAFMTKYMGIDEDKSLLLQKVYRHKLVHTGQPMSAYKHSDGNEYSWSMSRDCEGQIVYFPPRADDYKEGGKTYFLHMDVPTLKKDIVNGVELYTADLIGSEDLQQKFNVVLSKTFGLMYPD